MRVILVWHRRRRAATPKVVKRTPNLAVTLTSAVVALCVIMLVRDIVVQPEHLTDEETAFAEARTSGKLLLIDYQATWSVPSMEMSASLEALQPYLDGVFVPLRIDVSREPFERPGVAFVEPSGKVLRFVDYASTDELRRAAEQALRNR
jgi:hypothetical protein